MSKISASFLLIPLLVFSCIQVYGVENTYKSASGRFSFIFSDKWKYHSQENLQKLYKARINKLNQNSVLQEEYNDYKPNFEATFQLTDRGFMEYPYFVFKEYNLKDFKINRTISFNDFKKMMIKYDYDILEKYDLDDKNIDKKFYDNEENQILFSEKVIKVENSEGLDVRLIDFTAHFLREKFIGTLSFFCLESEYNLFKSDFEEIISSMKSQKTLTKFMNYLYF
jgi:hypothetical protein